MSFKPPQQQQQQQTLVHTLDSDLFNHIPTVAKTLITVNKIKAAANPYSSTVVASSSTVATSSSTVEKKKSLDNDDTGSSSTSSEESSSEEEEESDGGEANAAVENVRRHGEFIKNKRLLEEAETKHKSPPHSPNKRKHESASLVNMNDARKVPRHSINEFENGTKLLRETRDVVKKNVDESVRICEALKESNDSVIRQQDITIKEQNTLITQNQEIIAGHDQLYAKLEKREQDFLALRTQVRQEHTALEIEKAKWEEEKKEWEEEKKRIQSLFVSWSNKK